MGELPKLGLHGSNVCIKLFNESFLWKQEKQWLMVGADYKPTVSPEVGQLRFLDIKLEASLDGVRAVSGDVTDFLVCSLNVSGVFS